jgi:hypothetical protein
MADLQRRVTKAGEVRWDVRYRDDARQQRKRRLDAQRFARSDLSFWKPGWVAPSETEWRDKQRDVLAGDAWVADGNYHETLDLRLERARRRRIT